MLQQQRSLQELADVLSAFQLEGRVIDGGPHGTGHLHDTYRIRLAHGGANTNVILQRLNHLVFTDIKRLMDNVQRVTEHLHAKLLELNGRQPGRECLQLIPAKDGTMFVCLNGDAYWRLYHEIQDARTFDRITEPRQAYEAARAFARFQMLLGDLPDPPLHETITDFHNTPKRFEDLRAAVDADPCGRAQRCRADIEYALSQESITSVIIDDLAGGALPTCVTHNDTKLNNVMLDNRNGEGVCVIDLDTVMPGSSLYDFGDMVRSMVGDFEENEADQQAVFADIERFEMIVSGYMSAAAEFLSHREIELMAFSGQLITYEIGIRFLKDYLEGDVYFKISHPNENLDRARTQFALARSLCENEDQMVEIVGRHAH